MAEDAPFVLVEDGQVIEHRLVDPDGVSPHKLASDGGPRLRPFVDVARPNICEAMETATAGYAIEPALVTRTWDVARRSLPEQIAAVRTECGRRIYDTFPQWKQANFTARAAELIDTKGERELTGQENAEMAYLRSVWDWIKAVRVASNALEAQSPIPVDYASDDHWPEAFA